MKPFENLRRKCLRLCAIDSRITSIQVLLQLYLSKSSKMPVDLSCGQINSPVFSFETMYFPANPKGFLNIYSF